MTGRRVPAYKAVAVAVQARRERGSLRRGRETKIFPVPKVQVLWISMFQLHPSEHGRSPRKYPEVGLVSVSVSVANAGTRTLRLGFVWWVLVLIESTRTHLAPQCCA